MTWLLGLGRPANRYAAAWLSGDARTMTKQIHLAAHFPGVNNATVWSDPASGSQVEFDSFRQFAPDRRARAAINHTVPTFE
jgi:hypothetical protein